MMRPPPANAFQLRLIISMQTTISAFTVRLFPHMKNGAAVRQKTAPKAVLNQDRKRCRKWSENGADKKLAEKNTAAAEVNGVSDEDPSSAVTAVDEDQGEEITKQAG